MIEGKQAEIPLRPAQIEAAQFLYHRLLVWNRAEKTLRSLAETFPRGADNDCVVTMKAASLNVLYGTWIMAPGKPAARIWSYLQRDSLDLVPELIDEVAKVKLGKSVHRLTSFTSKYFHFFVAPELFPMYDSFAARAVAAHLGLRASTSWTGRYAAYYESLSALCRDCRPSARWCDIDHYLWLAGQWLAWSQSGSTGVNQEVIDFVFENRDQEVQAMLLTLVGGLASG